MYQKAEDSKQRFNIWGSFYDIGEFRYRNALDITSKDIEKDQLIDNKVDAIVIMLNPGSSSPCSAEDVQTQRGIFYTEAKPDKAQYQIMSLMYHHDWKHVRILNLSDYRNAKSNEFKEMLMKDKLPDDHSIFQAGRRKEFDKLYNLKTNGITILGWSFEKEILDLAKLALQKELLNRIGINHPSISDLFKYPSPPSHKRKIEWLLEISEKIKLAV